MIRDELLQTLDVNAPVFNCECRIGQEVGALGIHSHDQLLGGTKRDRARASEAALKHAKDLEEEPPEPAALKAAADGSAPTGLTAAQANKRAKKYAGAGCKAASTSVLGRM